MKKEDWMCQSSFYFIFEIRHKHSGWRISTTGLERNYFEKNLELISTDYEKMKSPTLKTYWEKNGNVISNNGFNEFQILKTYEKTFGNFMHHTTMSSQLNSMIRRYIEQSNHHKEYGENSISKGKISLKTDKWILVPLIHQWVSSRRLNGDLFRITTKIK